MSRSHRSSVGLVLALVALLCLAACGSGGDSPGGTSEVVDTITVTISGDDIEPNGKRIAVERGAPFLLKIDSDVAGELHIHAKPQEMTVAFEAGQSEHTITFDAPGIFPAESHAHNKVALQFEVR
ncbi:hypothetical protein [Nocardioides sp. AE5]|uniref:hypothetical protein n=1 Tax=Nocardioides sp. AE5 TaxID=2962573 RepID=UPI002882A4DE|nr:hypothetical protein [Nocardioides sp. AE5]MDT0201883.1 hypothetical protein [Nocardioides sp. AE5]